LRQTAALPCHMLHVAGDLLRQLPRPASLSALAGRVCGLVEGIVRPLPSAATQIDAAETISLHIEDAQRRMPAGPQRRSAAGRYSQTA
jgi:hypothetical protein